MRCLGETPQRRLKRYKAGNIRIPQHIRHDKKSHVASPDIDLIEMADSAIARGDGDVFQLDVHVVFGYGEILVARFCISVEIFQRMVGESM